MFSVGYSYNQSASVTKSDSVNYPLVPVLGPADAVYIGTPGSTGTIVLVKPDLSTQTFVGLQAGQVLRVPSVRINNTTTDASNIVALWQI